MGFEGSIREVAHRPPSRPPSEHRRMCEFERNEELLGNIKEAGGFQNYVEQEHRHWYKKWELESAFPKTVDCLCCKDSRVVREVHDGVFATGLGVFLKDDPEKVEKFVSKLRAAGVRNTELHSDCGAVKLLANEIMNRYACTKEEARERAEQEMEQWAQTIATKLGGKCLGTREVVPSNFNPARVIYLDFTGRFNPGAAQEIFPDGFVVSGKYLPVYDMRRQVKTGISIATGEYGYGKLLNPEYAALPIVVVANNEKELEWARKMLKQVQKIAAHPIDGFIAPLREPK